MKPPVSPTRSEMMLRKNSMTELAITRGVTSFLEGSTPMARMASICSVTSWSRVRWPCRWSCGRRPSSRSAPARARAPWRAIPASRSATANRTAASVLEVCSASTAPVKKPVSTTMGSEPTPIRSACMMVSAKVARMGEEVADRAAGQQGIILHRQDLLFRKVRRREDWHA